MAHPGHPGGAARPCAAWSAALAGWGPRAAIAGSPQPAPTRRLEASFNQVFSPRPRRSGHQRSASLPDLEALDGPAEIQRGCCSSGSPGMRREGGSSSGRREGEGSPSDRWEARSPSGRGSASSRKREGGSAGGSAAGLTGSSPGSEGQRRGSSSIDECPSRLEVGPN